MIQSSYFLKITKILMVLTAMQSGVGAIDRDDSPSFGFSRLVKFSVSMLSVLPQTAGFPGSKSAVTVQSIFRYKPSPHDSLNFIEPSSNQNTTLMLPNTISIASYYYLQPDILLRHAYIHREQGNNEMSHCLSEIAAHKGSKYGAFNAGINFLYGIGTSRDESLAFKWIESAANQDLPKAVSQLAEFYQNGTVLNQNISEAIRLYTIASKANDPTAQYQLGMYLFNRTDSPDKLDDMDKGIRLVKAASDQHYRKAVEILPYLRDQMSLFLGLSIEF